MSETQVNNFSLISRLFGNLFYRSPTDPILSGVFDWLQQQGLSQVWALSTDKESEAAIDNLQMKIDLTLLDQEYQKLVENQKVSNDEVISKQNSRDEKLLKYQENQMKEYFTLIEDLKKSSKEFIENQNIVEILEVNNEKLITNQKLQNETMIQEQKALNQKLLQEQMSKMGEQKKINEKIIELLSQVLLKDLLDKYQGNIQELINQMKK